MYFKYKVKNFFNSSRFANTVSVLLAVTLVLVLCKGCGSTKTDEKSAEEIAGLKKEIANLKADNADLLQIVDSCCDCNKEKQDTIAKTQPVTKPVQQKPVVKQKPVTKPVQKKPVVKQKPVTKPVQQKTVVQRQQTTIVQTQQPIIIRDTIVKVVRDTVVKEVQPVVQRNNVDTIRNVSYTLYIMNSKRR